MKIVEVASLEESVPPKKYGGTELVIANTIKGMVARGHEVYLFGVGSSSTEAKQISFLPKTLRETYPFDEIIEWRLYYSYRYLSEVIKKINEIKPDIVHNHLGWTLNEFSDLIDCPIVTTLHGPITSISEKNSLDLNSGLNYVSISQSQRKAMPNINWVKNIYNGVDIEAFEVGEKKDRNYFLFLGRISPEKGIVELCEMIKKTKYKLKIAAKLDPFDKKYFDNEVKPLIDGDQIEYLGEVDHEGKKELLKNAKALLMWLNWEEPFGLVFIEAFASGTPVIVNSRGAAPEIMQDGKTGFLVDTLDEMLDSLEKVWKIDNNYCRLYAEQRFSSQRMADEYILLAEELLSINSIR